MSVIAGTFREAGGRAFASRGGDRRRPAGRPPRRRSGSARPGPAGTAPSAGRAPGRAGGRAAPPNSTAAAVVDVACADGKLSRLGVPTSTCTRGCGGPRAAHHALDGDRRAVRRGDAGGRGEPVAAAAAGRASAPSRPSASQPAACSPNSDMPRAVAHDRSAARSAAAPLRVRAPRSGATGISTVSAAAGGAGAGGRWSRPRVGVSWRWRSGCQPAMLRGVAPPMPGHALRACRPVTGVAGREPQTYSQPSRLEPALEHHGEAVVGVGGRHLVRDVEQGRVGVAHRHAVPRPDAASPGRWACRRTRRRPRRPPRGHARPRRAPWPSSPRAATSPRGRGGGRR